MSMRNFLRQMGFTREGLKKALWIVFLAFIVTIAMW